tara:strand:+ start:372 stop:620 length:249 start_codon:yes stop_codon:yes gene_type:complete
MKHDYYNCRIYVVRYEDSEVEYCSFFPSEQQAMKGRADFRRRYKKTASIERVDIKNSKKYFLSLFNKYAIKEKSREMYDYKI